MEYIRLSRLYPFAGDPRFPPTSGQVCLSASLPLLPSVTPSALIQTPKQPSGVTLNGTDVLRTRKVPAAPIARALTFLPPPLS